MTPNQPLGWSIARGLYTPPLDGTVSGPGGATNVGTLVPLVSSPFDGSMRCVVVDDRGRPIDHNVLIGTASIETDADTGPPIDVAQYIDAARYNAIGLPAIEGANDGDEVLRLGGSQPEYAACPTTLVLANVFDGGAVRTGDLASPVTTTVSLLPCGGNLLADQPPAAVVQALVRNEFAQRFSTSRPVAGSFALQLSLFDTMQPDRSIFHVGIAGTLTGQTDLNAVGGGGLVGVALEAHDGVGPAARQYHAAAPLGAVGVRTEPAVLALLRPPCPGDCNGDGQVIINELLLGVNIGLDATPVEACLAADGDDSRTVRVDEVIRAVQSALTSCPAPKIPTTPVEPAGTPTPTPLPPSAPGPDITFLGIASADDIPQEPSGVDDAGRPIFVWPVGQGLSLIVEARPGTNLTPVGRQAAVQDGASLPDLQVILSNPLGDGSMALCDTDLPNVGGVPAVQPFEFSDTPEVIQAINDFGCRADDGFGDPQGRAAPPGACTRLQPSGEIGPVAKRTTVQFCIPIARAWAFPEGQTRIAARVRDVTGQTGPPREIVLQIQSAP
jgi:hypothetical protein